LTIVRISFTTPKAALAGVILEIFSAISRAVIATSREEMMWS